MRREELHGDVFRIPEWPWPVCAVEVPCVEGAELCARAAAVAVEAPESAGWSPMCAEHGELERLHGRRLVPLEALEDPGRRPAGETALDVFRAGLAELGVEWVCPQRLELLKPADLERLLMAVREVCLEHRRRELLEDGGAK